MLNSMSPGTALILGLLVGLLIGYVFRKYAEKKWPDYALALDVIVKQYGDAAEQKLRDARRALRERQARDGT